MTRRPHHARDGADIAHRCFVAYATKDRGLIEAVLSEDFTVKFSNLEPDEVAELAGVPSSAANIRSAIQMGCKALKKDGVDYRPTELKEWLGLTAATAVLKRA